MSNQTIIVKNWA